MPKKYDRDPDTFDEDDMPCMCAVCNGWFDLNDGDTDPLNEDTVICEKCARERQEEVDRREEIQEHLEWISNAEYEIKYAKEQLAKLKYDPEKDKFE